MIGYDVTFTGFIFNIISGLFVCIFIILIYEKNFSIRSVIINSLLLAVLFTLFSKFVFMTGSVAFIILSALATVLFIGLLARALFKLNFIQGMVVAALVCSVQLVTAITSFVVMSLAGLETGSTGTDKTEMLVNNISGLVINLAFVLMVLYLKPLFKMIRNLGNKSNLFIAVDIILMIIILSVNVYFVYRTPGQQETKYEIIGLITLIFLAYFAVGMKHLSRLSQLERGHQELEHQKFYNMTLSSLVDDLRKFKHGFDNTLATIRGYFHAGDWDGLKAYINELIETNNRFNVAESMVLYQIKNAGIIGILVDKYEYAKEKNVFIHVSVQDEVSEVNMKIGDLCECLGILLDNAIEAAAESRERYVRLVVTNTGGIVTFSIENSVDKMPDIARISLKGWSTKGSKRGLGLWILKNTVNKYSNVILNTFSDDKRFRQDLIIS